MLVLCGCRPGEDIVAIKAEDDASADTSLPPIEDGATPRPDVSIEHDEPPVIMDTVVPPLDVAGDPGITPPPVDVTPPTCESTGPILSIRRVNGESSEACAGQLAAHTFTHALCSCEDLSLAALSTGSFDSSAADKSIVPAGAAVGIRGNYPPTGSRIGGSLTVAGTARPPAVSGGIDIQGDLRLAGGATFFSQLTVKRDAWFMSRVFYWGFVNIGRDVYLAPPAGMLQGLGPTPAVGGTYISRTFTIDDPCGCAERLDVAEMEKIGGARNDNAARGIDPAMLSNVTNVTNLSLLCGRYRFDSIGGTGALQLTITGRTAIFVDGNVALSDAFELVIAPGADAELDWFIRGSLSIGARAQVGDPARPSLTRIYVAGPGSADAGPDVTDIVLSSGQIGANIYAPNTNVNIAAAGVAGSVYGKNVSVGGAFIRYDRAILSKGNKCEQPIVCDKCHTCNGGTACMGGTCGPCKEDGDCCTPLVCVQGSCQPLLFP